MMHHKIKDGGGIVRHDFSEPISYDFFFSPCMPRYTGLNWPKDLSALTFGIRTMKV